MTPVFGSSVSRVDLSSRDVVAMPFVDPTKNNSPSPQQYQPNADKDLVKSKLGEFYNGPVISEPRMTNAF